jgi:hypothetical protein
MSLFCAGTKVTTGDLFNHLQIALLSQTLRNLESQRIQEERRMVPKVVASKSGSCRSGGRQPMVRNL